MRLLIVNGSARGKQGTTGLLVGRLVEGVLAAGAAVTQIQLSTIRMQRCLGCRECQQPGEGLLHCVYEDRDAFGAVLDAWRACDVVVLATPVYMLGMSALLKTCLERLFATMDSNDMHVNAHGLIHHHTERAISGKPFVVMVNYANFEDATGANTTQYFRQYARFLEARPVGWLVRNATPLLVDPPAAYARRVDTVLAAYGRAGRDLAEGGRIRAGTQRAANAELVPIPMFRYLRHLPVIKQRIVAEAMGRE